MSLPTKQYEDIIFSAEFLASMLDYEGKPKAARLVRSLAYQRAELLEVLEKFVKAGQESKSVLEFSSMCDEFIEYATDVVARTKGAE